MTATAAIPVDANEQAQDFRIRCFALLMLASAVSAGLAVAIGHPAEFAFCVFMPAYVIWVVSDMRVHGVVGGVFAFRRDLLVRKTHVHRALGMAYCAMILLSGLAGLAMALFSSGGLPAHAGFTLLALIWLSTTMLGLRAIKRRDVACHRRWMVRSYAACYAAVTLRVELPLYVVAFGSFETAYQLVSWTCWVFNLVFAEWWLRNTTVAGVFRRGRDPRLARGV